jgi:uncharacterized protein (DUF1330 family)
MITVAPGSIDQFVAEDDGMSIVMLNLLRFKAKAGRQRYFEYLEIAGPILSRHGAEILFVGNGTAALAAEPGQAWDAMALVRYPTRAHFLAMVGDPEYAIANELRMSALDEAVLQPMKPL